MFAMAAVRLVAFVLLVGGNHGGGGGGGVVGVLGQLEDEFVFALENPSAASPGLFVMSGPGVAKGIYDGYPEVCPRQDDDVYYWIDTATYEREGRLNYFNTRRLPGDVVFAPGLCTTSHISHATVKKALAEAPGLLADGRAYRANDLGDRRLNEITFEPGLWSDGYRGIALASPREDHDALRPFVDYLFGDFNELGSIYSQRGPRWNKNDLYDSASSYLQGKDQLAIRPDVTVWVLKELHKMSGIDLPDSLVRQMASLQGAAFLLALAPGASIDEVGAHVGISAATLNSIKDSYINIYEAAINDSPHLLEILGGAENARKAAAQLLDVFFFAGGLGVPVLIRSAIGAYVSGLADPNKVDVTTQRGLTLYVLESARVVNPVPSLPYTLSNGQRLVPQISMAGWDTSVYGPDAEHEFRIRGNIRYYHERSLSFAEPALPVGGDPSTARICPARSLSVAMAVQFLRALNLTRFCADPATPVFRRKDSHWADFNITTTSCSPPEPRPTRCEQCLIALEHGRSAGAAGPNRGMKCRTAVKANSGGYRKIERKRNEMCTMILLQGKCNWEACNQQEFCSAEEKPEEGC